MNNKVIKQLGRILLEKGVINDEQLKDALAEQQKTKEFLGAVLKRKFGIKDDDLSKALSEQFGMPFVTLKNKYIDWDFVKQFSPSFIVDSKCFPLKKDDLEMTIGVTNPLDAWALKKAEEASRGFKLKLVLVSEEDLKDAVKRFKEYIKNSVYKLSEQEREP
jgi:type IV pilus assembly protein PilB